MLRDSSSRLPSPSLLPPPPPLSLSLVDTSSFPPSMAILPLYPHESSSRKLRVPFPFQPGCFPLYSWIISSVCKYSCSSIVSNEIHWSFQHTTSFFIFFDKLLPNKENVCDNHVFPIDSFGFPFPFSYSMSQPWEYSLVTQILPSSTNFTLICLRQTRKSIHHFRPFRKTISDFRLRDQVRD